MSSTSDTASTSFPACLTPRDMIMLTWPEENLPSPYIYAAVEATFESRLFRQREWKLHKLAWLPRIFSYAVEQQLRKYDTSSVIISREFDQENLGRTNGDVLLSFFHFQFLNLNATRFDIIRQKYASRIIGRSNRFFSNEVKITREVEMTRGYKRTMTDDN